jgi:hypothetical protein
MRAILIHKPSCLAIDKSTTNTSGSSGDRSSLYGISIVSQ